MITLQNLTKSYSGKAVFNNLNCSFYEGKIYGIVGNNGEGKTTFFNCLYGLDKNYTGSVSVEEGRDLRTISGYLPTDLFFYSRITGREYLKFMAGICNKDVSGFDVWAQLFQLPLDAFISTYSTGMKKKIALTGLIIQDRDVYFLDEPFNGLDAISCITVQQILMELKNKNKIIVVSSHIVDTLTEICDSILLLHGRQFMNEYNPETFSDLKSDLINIFSQKNESIIKKIFA